MARLDDNKLQAILDLLAEIKADCNGLRDDLLRHDHGAGGTYASAAIRLNSGANSLISGTATSSIVKNISTSVDDLYKR